MQIAMEIPLFFLKQTIKQVGTGLIWFGYKLGSTRFNRSPARKLS